MITKRKNIMYIWGKIVPNWLLWGECIVLLASLVIIVTGGDPFECMTKDLW